MLYYTAQLVNGGPQCISAAVASQPQGPFIDTSAGPFACQPTLGGSIDPSPFVNADGTPYLVWKSTGEAGQADHDLVASNSIRREPDWSGPAPPRCSSPTRAGRAGTSRPPTSS